MALLEENPTWSHRDAENSVKNRLMLDVVRVAGLLRTDRWNLQALVQNCPVPVQPLAATNDSALTDPDRSVLLNRLPLITSPFWKVVTRSIASDQRYGFITY